MPGGCRRIRPIQYEITLSLIVPQNQSQQASTVFEYIQEAIRSSQETEALLLAQTEEQRFLLRKIFLRRLLRGKLPLASDILREQSQVGLNLEGTYWTVASSISRKLCGPVPGR